MTKQLRAPHDAISVEIQNCGDHFFVKYAGSTLEALCDAGCIDGDTLDLFSRTRQRVNYTELGTCRRSRWYGHGRSPGWHILWNVWPADLERLPGCSSADMPESADLSRTEALAMLSVVREEIGLGGMGLKRKERAIGRHQRTVQWAVFENVIWPNWQFICGRAEPAPAA